MIKIIQKRALLTALIMGVLVSFFVPANVQAKATKVNAVVTFILGKVTYERNGRNRGKVSNRMQLFAGDKLITGKNGHVHITYGQNHVVKVEPNAEVKISTKKFPRDNMIMVVYGKIKASSLKESDPNDGSPQFKVVTPTSVCAVRGTDFSISVAQNGSSATQLNSGKVYFTQGANGVQLNQAGNATALVGQQQPQTTSNAAQIDNTLATENDKLKNDPNGVANGYKQQNAYFQASANQNGQAAVELTNTINAVDPNKATKDDIAKVDDQKAQVNNKTENDYYQNDLQSDALNRIITSYKQGKDRINAALFRQIKMNSDSIAKLQATNMENIRKIMEQYEAKRKEIFDRLEKTRKDTQDQLDKVKDRTKFDFDKIKPQFKPQGGGQ